jgi:hypothetical protein
MPAGGASDSDFEAMRLKTDALVSSFNEHYRDAVLTPSRSRALPSPNSTASTQAASIVRFPASSPPNHPVVVTASHPLSHAPAKNTSPPSQQQQAPAAASATSSDFVYVIRLPPCLRIAVDVFSRSQVLPRHVDAGAV